MCSLEFRSDLCRRTPQAERRGTLVPAATLGVLGPAWACAAIRSSRIDVPCNASWRCRCGLSCCPRRATSRLTWLRCESPECKFGTAGAGQPANLQAKICFVRVATSCSSRQLLRSCVCPQACAVLPIQCHPAHPALLWPSTYPAGHLQPDLRGGAHCHRPGRDCGRGQAAGQQVQVGRARHRRRVGAEKRGLRRNGTCRWCCRVWPCQCVSQANSK